MEVDVLIVGAGPAGSTTARYCSEKGLEVLIMDRRKEIGYPVQCGEYLPNTEEMYSMFPKSMDLEELFTIPDELISSMSGYVDLISPKQKIYHCEFGGRTLDRRAFDKHLAKLAVEEGARLELGASFLGLEGGVARTTLGDVNAKVIVGADGPNSRTARDAGMKNPETRYPAVTCQAQGEFEPVVKMYFGAVAPGGYAWVIPKRKGANIGVGYNPKLIKDRPSVLFAKFVSRFDAKISGVTMGLVPQSGPVERTVSGKVLLVGDAAGQVMATNGGGIPIAMIAGRIAGQTVKEHFKKGLPLAEYERRWKSVLEKPLKDSVWTRKLADVFFPTERRTEFAMTVLGKRGLARAIRCGRVFYLF